MAIHPQGGDSGEHSPLRPVPYNPLEKRELARTVEAALLDTQSQPLGEVPEFLGTGIYVLYYDGPHDLYLPISGTATPIYVGKAVPRGARTARNDDSVVGKELRDRIDEHRESITWAADLDPADFYVRYLVTDELFISLAERLMIRSFRPVWNRVVDGFGNHDPGAGRYDQRVSPWDTLHPGRPWVPRLRKPCKYTFEQIVARVQAHFMSPQVAAEVSLPPTAPETPTLFDLLDQDGDDLEEESEE
jgi:hypothetical protein